MNLKYSTIITTINDQTVLPLFIVNPRALAPNPMMDGELIFEVYTSDETFLQIIDVNKDYNIKISVSFEASSYHKYFACRLFSKTETPHGTDGFKRYVLTWKYLMRSVVLNLPREIDPFIDILPDERTQGLNWKKLGF